ncbi:MAG: nitroreductase family protein [Chitinophagaceae bacterium]|nr:nitroreductase family protein [Chitinophagaceae bacterium]
MKITKLINGFPFVKYSRDEYDEAEMRQRAESFAAWMNTRRTCRDFSDKPVPKEVIENIILSASTAPSGAHKQPWTFCVVMDPEIKKQIRVEAEKEEYESYNGRMPEDWKKDLLPLQTDWKKEFLEIAPYLIIVFKKSYDLDADGKKTNTYYATESCGLACGFLLAAIHNAGLVALTHTPSPMNFLSKVLNRPVNEKPFLLIPVGYAAAECWVPDIKRKPLEEVSEFY